MIHTWGGYSSNVYIRGCPSGYLDFHRLVGHRPGPRDPIARGTCAKCLRGGRGERGIGRCPSQAIDFYQTRSK